jgi:transposase
MPHTITLAARDMELGVNAIALLRDDMNERAAVRALLDHGNAGAALRLALRLMPRGYVVPWLCQCVRAEALDDDALDGLLVAEAWLRERGEPRRRNALAFAAERYYVGIGALVAASAAWSEGFLLDGEDKEVVPVAPQLMAVMAAAALLTLASTRTDFDAQCRAFVAAAIGLLPPEISE